MKDNWKMSDDEWDSLTKDQQGDWIQFWSIESGEEEEEEIDKND